MKMVVMATSLEIGSESYEQFIVLTLAGGCVLCFSFTSSVVSEKLSIKVDAGLFKTVAVATILATGTEPPMKTSSLVATSM